MEQVSIRIEDGLLYLMAQSDMETHLYAITYSVSEGNLMIQKVELTIMPTLLGMPSPSWRLH